MPLCCDAPDRGAEDKSDTKRSPDHPEPRGAVFFAGNIRNIGRGSGVGRARDACEDTANQQHPKHIRQGHNDIINRENEQRYDQHRFSPVSIR